MAGYNKRTLCAETSQGGLPPFPLPPVVAVEGSGPSRTPFKGPWKIGNLEVSEKTPRSILRDPLGSDSTSFIANFSVSLPQLKPIVGGLGGQLPDPSMEYYGRGPLIFFFGEWLLSGIEIIFLSFACRATESPLCRIEHCASEAWPSTLNECKTSSTHGISEPRVAISCPPDSLPSGVAVQAGDAGLPLRAAHTLPC